MEMKIAKFLNRDWEKKGGILRTTDDTCRIHSKHIPKGTLELYLHSHCVR